VREAFDALLLYCLEPYSRHRNLQVSTSIRLVRQCAPGV